MAEGFCKALTLYPCFGHRHDPLCVLPALRPDGDDSAKVFPPRTAPSTGGTSQWSSDSDSGLDAGWDVERHCINQWVNRGDLGELFRPFVA
jgi:hypothetical protein